VTPVASYAAAGVDIVAGEEAVERIKGLVAATARPGVLGGIGGFSGLFALDTSAHRHPVLVSSTDGVGTKMQVARATGRYDTIGQDLVAMCVDDIVCSGAEPLFLLDYISVGRLDPARIEAVVGGVAEGCRRAGCALLGGETAEHPGVMDPDDLDLAGFAVGVVERGEELGPSRVEVGDALVGLLSPGLRSNGYSLARAVLLDGAGLALTAPAWPGAPRSLADELLLPSVIYAPAVLAAIGAARSGVHAAAHITGGGIVGNVARLLPPSTDAVLRRDAWEEPRIFEEIRRLGEIEAGEMARVFNLGLGMVVACAPDSAAAVVAAAEAAGCAAVVVGSVSGGTGTVHLS